MGAEKCFGVKEWCERGEGWLTIHYTFAFTEKVMWVSSPHPACVVFHGEKSFWQQFSLWNKIQCINDGNEGNPGALAGVAVGCPTTTTVCAGAVCSFSCS